MGIFIDSCWFIFSTCLIWLFSFLAMRFLRPRKGNHFKRENGLMEKEITDSIVRNDESVVEEEASTLCFKFQYQFSDQQELQQQPASEDKSKDQLHGGIDQEEFLMKDDKSTNFMEILSSDGHSSLSSEAEKFLNIEDLDEKKLSELKAKRTNKATVFRTKFSCSNLEAESICALTDSNSVTSKGLQKPCLITSSRGSVHSDEDEQFLKHKTSEEPVSSGKFTRTFRGRLFFEDFSGFNSETDSLSASDGYSVKELALDSDSNGFFSDSDSDEYVPQEDVIKVHGELLFADSTSLEESQLQPIHNSEAETVAADDLFSSLIKNQIMSTENQPDCESDSRKVVINQVHDDESIPAQKQEGSELANVNSCDDDDDDEQHETEVKQNTSKRDDDDTDGVDGTVSESSTFFELPLDSLVGTISSADEEWDKFDKEVGREEKVSQDRLGGKETEPVVALDDEEYNELETLWEHENLIEQLKMELRKARLPTILEESVAPKVVEDLKPWKINNKFLHKDPMEELHEFHNCYRERMRKFDILNLQKVNTIGFLDLKDSGRSMRSKRLMVPSIKSILLQNLWSCNLQTDIDPTHKLIKEVKNDLELVYVGQICLSWEFLRWQYEKARELPEFEHQYNHVADELQQFQVILQRFIEDESLEGSRLPNYIKGRSLVKNLLQVPQVREDTLKEKLEDKSKGNFVVTIETLEDIMEESIRIFWEFVKADKDETPGFLKVLMGAHAELEDPTDSKLMEDIQINLDKKEKRLKDILRTGNCLVKKFKKPKDDRSNQELFFSQVDLKLVARVMRMSRITTEQLVWCHAKLNNIRFIEAKVHRENSFLLFPA
ncbi:uncharacterized protein LOC122042396 isoform X1 [Zingiber officinale]|uniref:uncharacterized protein LOC122042396 isoform X1 n=1 Tax=Zingiber officinale TaxID=94328 RepID=UPI001C4B3A3F|nr:uncharacterized protein LOC122042396 isoform X1 [Zingiber officinale]